MCATWICCPFVAHPGNIGQHPAALDGTASPDFEYETAPSDTPQPTSEPPLKAEIIGSNPIRGTSFFLLPSNHACHKALIGVHQIGSPQRRLPAPSEVEDDSSAEAVADSLREVAQMAKVVASDSRSRLHFDADKAALSRLEPTDYTSVARRRFAGTGEGGARVGCARRRRRRLAPDQVDPWVTSCEKDVPALLGMPGFMGPHLVADGATGDGESHSSW